MQNRVIIYPTDTVYGIGASVNDKEGIKRIYEIKHRPLNKPLAVLCANVGQIEEIAYLNNDARKLIAAFMPGALTVIVKSKENIVESMGLQTIGVRIPNYKLAIEILERNGPMATTSVNESGEPSLNNYDEIKEDYDDLVDLIVPPSGEKTSSLASTVVDITGPVKVLREGAITLEEIKKVLISE